MGLIISYSWPLWLADDDYIITIHALKTPIYDVRFNVVHHTIVKYITYYILLQHGCLAFRDIYTQCYILCYVMCYIKDWYYDIATNIARTNMLYVMRYKPGEHDT